MTHTEALRAALERFCDATACIPLPGQPVTTTMVQTLGMALSEARAVLDAAPPALTEEQQLEAFKAWAGREYRNAETYTARDLAHGFNAWRAARA